MWTRFERSPWRRHARQATLIALAALPSCGQDPGERPQPVRLLRPSALTMPGTQRLLDHYNAKLPHVLVSQHGASASGSVAVVSALNVGEGDVAMAQADVVYAAFRRGTENAPYSHANLSAIAVLFVNKFYVFVPRNSALRRIEHLRGKQVAVAQRGYSGELLTRIVLAAHEMSYSDIRMDFQPLEEMGQRFAHGTMDAMIIVGGLDYDARAISAPADPHTLRLLPISDGAIARLRADHPFLKPIVLPPDELPGQQEPVRTVGVDQLLICRRDLDAKLVYELTKELFAWPEFETRYSVTREFAAAAPIPLHPGAARYYREQEVLR